MKSDLQKLVGDPIQYGQLFDKLTILQAYYNSFLSSEYADNTSFFYIYNTLASTLPVASSMYSQLICYKLKARDGKSRIILENHWCRPSYLKKFKPAVQRFKKYGKKSLL
jgi:hypothetical protein